MHILPLFKQGSRTRTALDLGGALQRWHSALLECLPEKLRGTFSKEQVRMVLEVSGETAAARLEKGGVAQSNPRTVRNRPEELRALASQVEGAGAELTLLVPRTTVLLKRVHLPVQVKDNLSQALAYEIDRLTPFRAEDIYFDYRLLPSEAQTQLLVELACIKRESADSWLQGLAAVGRQPLEMGWSGAWVGANLLPAAVRRPISGSRLISWLLWTLALLLFAAVLLTPLLQKREIAIDLGARLDVARKEAGQVAELRSELEQAAEAANFMRQKKLDAPLVSVLLRKLTELIPDDTWVNQLNILGNVVDVRGESEHATDLIEILSRDPAFQNINFKSPVVGIRNTDRERFHIEFRFVSGGAG